MVVIEKKKTGKEITSVGKGVEKLEPSYLRVGTAIFIYKTVQALWKNRLEVSQ